MSTGGLTIVFIITVLLNLSLGIYILVRYKRDPYRSNHNTTDQDSRQPKGGAGEYTESPLVDMLKDQLAYSREDVSELQGEVKELADQIAGLRNDLLIHLMASSKEYKIDIGRVEIELGKINNRLDNYRLLLSQIEARK